VQLEDIRIELRPRRPWEAVDLGLAMVRRWWLPVFSVWFILATPLFLLINLLTEASIWAPVIFWWFKPVLDRPMLYIYSRAVFGAEPSVGDTLRAFPQLLLNTGLLWHLTLGRVVDVSRSYRLPVMQLEGLKGAERRARLRAIGARDSGHAVGMGIAYIHIEMALAIAALWLGFLLIPEGVDFDPLAWLGGENLESRMVTNTVYWLATAVIEPAYVASGFALYLNRRTVLEAWDIELNLKRMARRLERLAPRGAASGSSLGCALILAMALTHSPDSFAATDTNKNSVKTPVTRADPQALVQTILANEVFGRDETVKRWRLRNPEEETKQERSHTGLEHFLGGLGSALAAIVRATMWIIAIGAGIALLVYLAGHADAIRDLFRRSKPRQRATMPNSIGNLSIDARSLPDDIAMAAEQAWKDGNARQALALLYRGTIVHLVQRGVRLGVAATEGDVVRGAQPLVDEGALEALKRLVRTWQQLAYAHRLPDDEHFTTLVTGFRLHYVSAAK
jgi:hypothetical protein